MASSIAMTATRASTAGCAALLFLLATGCSTAQDGWAPPVPRNPLSLTPAKGHVVNMNDPYAMAYVVQDVRNLLEAGAWRRTARRPRAGRYLDGLRGREFTTDLAGARGGLPRYCHLSHSVLVKPGL